VKPYKNRPDGVIPVNLSLDKEAAELLAQLAPTKKAHGRFISRLLYEFAARQEERQRVRKALESTLEGVTV
jgi:hypothetical protein